MSTVDGKPPRKADQLLQALSKKYEDKARDRETRSSGGTTPTRRTPRGSRERLSTADLADDASNLSSVRGLSARGSPSVRTELFSPSSRRSPSLDGLRSNRRVESRSPAVRASPSLFEKAASPARHFSPVQSPGLLEKARISPSSTPARRSSPSPARLTSPSPARLTSPSPGLASRSELDTSVDELDQRDDTEQEAGSVRTPRRSERSRLFGRTSTPNEPSPGELLRHDNDVRSSTEFDKSLDEHVSRDYTEETDDMNTSQETTSNIVPADSSPDNSYKENKPTGDTLSDAPSASPVKRAYGSSLYGRSKRSAADQSGSNTRSRLFDSNPYRSPERSMDLTSASVQDDRPESRRSSVSNYSFSQPIAAGSPRSSMATSPLPPRNYAIEKEQTDSQLRKLELQNSSLKLENKSLKDKYNRAQSQIVHTETKLKTLENEIHKLRCERKKELSFSRQKNTEENESLQESAREEKDELKRKVELLKVENESLEKELASSRRMTETAIQSTDIFRIISGYKVESSSLRDEIKTLKLLLKESENSVNNEAEARKRTAETNRNLTNMNNVLKQQFEVDSGGSVADKQVKGIESRLKITEDRLFQERADRAGKLSEIEDKLLNENAKLQVDVKEVSRQLSREQEKLRLTDVKLHELKEQQMSLNFLTQGTSGSRRFTAIHRSSGDGKKFSSEVAKIVEIIHKESGAQLHQEEDVILYLHNKERVVMKQLNDWKNELQQLKDMHRQTAGEKDVRRMLEELQDSRQRTEEVENTLNGQISLLVKQKHDSMAAVKSGEDKIEALEAELEYLRVQVKVGGGPMPTGDSSFSEYSSEKGAKLESEVNALKVKLAQSERSSRLNGNEISSLQEQLAAKSSSLEQAILEIETMRKERSTEESETDRKQRVIDELTVQIKGWQANITSLKEKNGLLSQAKLDLEGRLEVLTSEVDHANVHLLSSSRSVEETNSQKSHLELELAEKAEEVKVLKERYESLDGKHIETREELILNRDHVSKLQKQVDDLHQQLVAKSSEYESMNSRLQSQETSYTTTEEHLLAAERQMDELKTALSLEKLNYNKLKSETERETASHKHDSSKLQREISALTQTVDTLRGHKAELSKDIEVSKVRLAELQARLTEAQSSIASHKEKEKMLSEERDRLTEDKHDAKLQAAKVEAEHKQEMQDLSRTLQELKQQNVQLKTNVESTQTNMGFEKERVTSELEHTKKQLTKKESDIERLAEGISMSKKEVELKQSRVRELETELDEANYKNKERVEELNQALRQRNQEIVAFEHSLKALDSESATKKELEIRVHRLDDELQEKSSVEQRLRNELASVAERKARDESTIGQLKSQATHSEEKQLEEVSRVKILLDKATEERKCHSELFDKEKTTLQDKLNLVSSDLKAAEATISVMRESKQTQLSSLSSLEKKGESLKSQLQESQVNERLAEQKLASIKEQMGDTRARMNKAEERVTELSTSLVMAESNVKVEREKIHYLKSEKEDLESTKMSSDYKVEMYHKEAETLQNENASLRGQLDTQREVVEIKSKKQIQQLRGQMDASEKEKTRLQAANQELSFNMERVRDQLTSSADDAQVYKQKSLSLEQRLIEIEARLNKSELSVMSRDDIQEKLNKRNLDLELELNELKNLLTRMEGNSAAQDLESSKIDNLTRAELNRTMTEWSVRLQALLDNERSKQKGGGHDGQHPDHNIKVVELESKLKHELLMHTVTKNQLKSLEDENMKLRKRLLTSGSSSRRSPSNKSREELIREQIMQSEMRVAAKMGLPSTRLLGTTMLTGTMTSRPPTLRFSPNKLQREDNFAGMSVLDSLGFTSPIHGRLNNTLSPDNSFRDDDLHSQQSYHD